MSFLTPLSDKRIPNIELVSLGFDEHGMREPIPVRIDEQITNTLQEFPDAGINGTKIENLNVGRLRAGTLSIDTYVQSTGYVAGTTGWRIDGAGNAEFSTITLTGGTIRYGKTSFSDSTNAGYYISSSGIYFGSALDASRLKYDIGGATLDLIGTISSRSTATVAAAINSSGNLVTDVINARLNTSTQAMLAGFDFGSADYSGALKAGTITWNTATGALTGGTGILVYRGGIIGANTGVATFSIDSATGSATFAGTLSAPTGSIGGFNLGADYIRDAANSMGLASTVTGGDDVRFWSGAAFASRDTAPFRVTESGALVATSATVNGSSITNYDIFGSGVDGDVTLGSNTTLSRDMYYNNLTMPSTYTLNANGYRVFVKGTLTRSGTGKIYNNGGDGGAGTDGTVAAAGTGGAAGTAAPGNTVPAGLVGKTGANGVFVGNPGAQTPGNTGTNGSANTETISSSNGVGGGAGGRGNNSGSNDGGPATSGGTATQSTYLPRSAATANFMYTKNLTVTVTPPTASSGSGSTGGVGTNCAGGSGGGGGSGGSGGILYIAVRTISDSGSGVLFEAKGGAGGAAGAGYSGGLNGIGGSGGGGGGNGGILILIYSTSSGSWTTSVAGGAGGAKSVAAGVSATKTDGTDGTTGASGEYIPLQV